MLRLLSFITCVLLLCSCGNHTAGSGPQGDTLALDHASLLTMVEDGASTHVTVSDPWHAGKTLQRLTLGTAEGNGVLRPLRRVVVFTTSHCQLFEYLGLACAMCSICSSPTSNNA